MTSKIERENYLFMNITRKRKKKKKKEKQMLDKNVTFQYLWSVGIIINGQKLSFYEK